MGRRIVSNVKTIDPVAKIVEYINSLIANEKAISKDYDPESVLATYHRGSITALEAVVAYIQRKDTHE